LGEETGRHSYMIHEHSTSIQVFEIDNFEFKSKLRMLQPKRHYMTTEVYFCKEKLKSYIF
jgi:hypothetical protein